MDLAVHYHVLRAWSNTLVVSGSELNEEDEMKKKQKKIDTIMLQGI